MDKERQIEGYDRDKIDERARRGVVVPLGDLEQLKEYIMLLSNRQIRERYAQLASAYVEKRIGWKFVAGMPNRFASLDNQEQVAPKSSVVQPLG